MNQESIKDAVTHLLQALDCDLDNPDLVETPARMAKLLYQEMNPEESLTSIFKVFDSPYKSAVYLLNHRTYTRCPHHLERAALDVSIGYIPQGKLLGLSKLGRVADYFASGLMLQEEVTDMIAEGLSGVLSPKGVAVHIIGRHACMQARGLKSINSSVATTRLMGIFKEDLKAREEFFWSIKNRGGGR